MSIKSWLQEISQVFQPTADKIKALKWSPAQQQVVTAIWESLGPTLQKSLWAFISLILAKYGPDAAKAILENVLNSIKKQ